MAKHEQGQAELLPPEGQRTQAVTTRADNAYELIMRAVADKDCDPAKLRELLAVRREWNADEAAAAFNAAIVAFQQECPTIEKGDKTHHGTYAKMDRTWGVIRPLLKKHGLSVTWESIKLVADVCVMDGHIRHTRGHAEPCHHEMPLPDKIPGQNASQRFGSGETYCKRYGTGAVLGIQTGEDDDGNGGGAELTPEHLAEIRALLARSGRAESFLLEVAGVGFVTDIREAQHQTLCNLLNMAIKHGGAK
jgi:hypothetical protein